MFCLTSVGGAKWWPRSVELKATQNEAAEAPLTNVVDVEKRLFDPL
jgi:hypothetical protein